MLANKAAVLFSGKSGYYMSVFDPDHFDPNHNILSIEDFEPTRKILFEGVELIIPNKAEKLLKHQYGDYMQLPAEEKRVPVHSLGVKIDLERDYKEYLPNLFGSK
jgi:lipopolysaccharide cholinephosphotransferase